MITTAPIVKDRSWPEEFEDLFRENYDLVYRTAYRVTGSAHDAEDVLQTLFLRLIRRSFSPDLERNPKAYLHRAAVNIALDVIRARQQRILTGAVDSLESIVSVHESREAETHEQLRAALATLHPKSAEILILRHVHGYTDVEIAKLLGTSRGTIAVSLYRSRARLRKFIGSFLKGKS